MKGSFPFSLFLPPLMQTNLATLKFQRFLSKTGWLTASDFCYFICLSHHLIKERVMKQSALVLFILAILWGCENTKGQNRHDPDHHENIMQNNRE
jgi:hypothetical protein